MNQSLQLRALCIAILLLLTLNRNAFGQRQGDLASLPFSPGPYRVGERLTYDISFSNFISAAPVELRVVARGKFFGREAVLLRGHVETTGVVNVALVAINEDFVSYVDPQTGMPFRSEQVSHNGPRPTERAQELSGNVFDFLAALYRIRASSFTDGSSQRLLVHNGADEYRIEWKVTGRESVKTKAGSFDTIVTQMRIVNDARTHSIKVFFSDDDRHLPVLATARLSGGEVRAELAASEMLKPIGAPPTPTPIVIAPAGPTPTPAITTTPSASDHLLDNLPFKVGEQLNYQVFLGTITMPAGNATFHVGARSNNFSRDSLLYTVHAQTTNAIQQVFFASDQISTYVDVKTLLPFRTEMKLIEGSTKPIKRSQSTRTMAPPPPIKT